jgi:phage terminase small subunit
MNPKVDAETRKARGTYRKDRDYEKRDARDPEEKKPRRPSYLEGNAAKFWYMHVDRLWDSEWLRRDNLDVFVMICEQWGEMIDLKEWFESPGIDDEIRTRFTIERTQYSVKEIERPESKLYEKLRESVYKKCKDIGVIPDKPAKAPATKKDKKPEKPDLKSFMAGPTGIAK